MGKQSTNFFINNALHIFVHYLKENKKKWASLCTWTFLWMGLFVPFLAHWHHLHTWFSYQCIHGCAIKVFWNWSISQRGGLFYHTLWWSISRGVKPNQTLLLQLKTKWHCRNLGWNLKPKYHIATPFVRSCATPEMGDSQPTLGLDATMMPQADVWWNHQKLWRIVVRAKPVDCVPAKQDNFCWSSLSLLVQIMHSTDYCNSNWDVRYAEWHVSFLILASRREGQWSEVEDILVEQILFAQRKKEGLP